MVVPAEIAVRIVVETRDAALEAAAGLAGYRPPEEDGAQLGVQRIAPVLPRSGHVATEPGDGAVEPGAAGGQRLAGDVRPANLADERREIAGDDFDVGRGK